jgi:hypothetical protein
MKNSLKIVAISLLVSFSIRVEAQDVIYKSDGIPIECTIESIDSNTIEYLPTKKSSKSQSLKTIQASFIFFENGQYILLPESKVNYEEVRSSKRLSKDIIITRYAEILEGKIENISKSEVEIFISETNSTLKVKGEEVLLAIYSSGKHILYKNPTEVKAILEYMQPKIIALGKTPVNSTEPQAPAATGRPSNLATAPSTTTVQTVSNPSTNNGTQLSGSNQVSTGDSRIENSNSANSNQIDSDVNLQKESNPQIINESENELTDIDFAEFSDKALQKIEDFTNFLGIISSKETYPESANQAIDLAVELFVNEDVQVEVSTTGYSQSVKRKIRDYLTRLKLLKYDKVEIKWAEINYVSNFRKAPDGNYYGTLTVMQTFRGYKDNQVVYSDVTQKDVEVVIKGMEKSLQGQKEMVWDVLLSDIGVVDTK